jgi:transcriptional regulator GlxA family with amidase domain
MGEKKQIAIVLYPGLTALDALGPYEVLKMLPDAEIRFLAHEPGPVTSDRGILTIGATHSFDETPSPYLFLVPGSEANTAVAMADEKLISWVRTAHLSSTWTTSVCSGALVLAAAGILNRSPATTHWAAQSTLAKFGATPMPDERVVRAGKVWTAAGVSAGIDLAFALFGEIAGQEEAEVAQLIIEYDPRPPFNAGHPSKASEIVRNRAKAEMTRLSKNPRSYVSTAKILWRIAIDRSRKAKQGRTWLGLK